MIAILVLEWKLFQVTAPFYGCNVNKFMERGTPLIFFFTLNCGNYCRGSDAMSDNWPQVMSLESMPLQANEIERFDGVDLGKRLALLVSV